MLQYTQFCFNMTGFGALKQVISCSDKQISITECVQFFSRLYDITWLGAKRFMKSVNCSKPGYTSINCSKIEHIPYILIFYIIIIEFDVNTVFWLDDPSGARLVMLDILGWFCDVINIFICQRQMQIVSKSLPFVTNLD
jgi:hypothetical protein